ncbi:MAG: sulfurtransferase [Xanthomonadales bacterium]|nr:sulfurtransferase [Gammaproteobacteria bacterium]MBT8050026.1 sulfurtransferase [Gammaproteobacteria bacterium]MBT8056055.1 sulfurtransferase [Gammaproteobacteria bacterium]NNJ79043.1 sulfurtransferase [Xanthomonadales bacterium]NNL03799.1 sulfurtransferase [Xanthomonadales bacterium]
MSVTGRILLSAEQLEAGIQNGGCLVVDCRFELENPDEGRRAWLKGHIPGARYAHLDDDLSSPIEPHTGRHPLPSTANFARFLGRIGWTEDRLLIAYDDGPGAFALRLWWLMRYHAKPAALLDGGLDAWKAAGGALEAGETASPSTAVPDLREDPAMTVDTAELAENLESLTILDARGSERFTGAVEPLDTRAGHIPGALNRPFGSNLELNGRFRDAEELREEFDDLFEGKALGSVVHSCGSGVSACHNLFAMELAGLAGTRLYPGSWSEWIRNPERPIATGP